MHMLCLENAMHYNREVCATTWCATQTEHQIPPTGQLTMAR